MGKTQMISESLQNLITRSITQINATFPGQISEIRHTLNHDGVRFEIIGKGWGYNKIFKMSKMHPFYLSDQHFQCETARLIETIKIHLEKMK